MTVTERQPRERSVSCGRCLHRQTFNWDAVCDGCRWVVLERQGRWLVMSPKGQLEAVYRHRDVAERRAAWFNSPNRVKGKR